MMQCMMCNRQIRPFPAGNGPLTYTIQHVCMYAAIPYYRKAGPFVLCENRRVLNDIGSCIKESTPSAEIRQTLPLPRMCLFSKIIFKNSDETRLEKLNLLYQRKKSHPTHTKPNPETCLRHIRQRSYLLIRSGVISKT